jgi:hypothetical protein
MECADYVHLLSEDHPELAREIEAFQTMENVLKWLNRGGVSLAAIDLVQQDEYNHDVLIPFESPAGYLVFGIT